MEDIKLTAGELKDLIDLRTDVTNMLINLGQLAMEKKQILKEIGEKETEILSSQEPLKKRETDLYSSIGNKYGEGNVNLESGVFSPSEKKEDEKI